MIRQTRASGERKTKICFTPLICIWNRANLTHTHTLRDQRREQISIRSIQFPRIPFNAHVFLIWSERKKCKTKSVSWCQQATADTIPKDVRRKNQNVEATTTATTKHFHIDHFFIARIHLRRMNVCWNIVCGSTGWCCCSSQIPTSITTRPYAPNAHIRCIFYYFVVYFWLRYVGFASHIFTSLSVHCVRGAYNIYSRHMSLLQSKLTSSSLRFFSRTIAASVRSYS